MHGANTLRVLALAYMFAYKANSNDQFQGGNTPYEVRKNIRYEEIDTTPSSERFKQVFGTCGLLHFIFPFVPFDGE